MTGPVPTSIKVIGILGIVYSGLALIATPCSIFLTFHPMAPNPAMDSLRQDPAYIGYYIVSMTVHFAMALLLLLGSIGSLKLKPAARTAMISYAYALIAVTLINVVFTLILVTPKLNAAFAADPKLPPGMGNMMKVLSIAGVVLSLLWSGAISGVILYFYSRTVAVNAFQGIFPPQPNDLPVEFPGDPRVGGG